MAKPLAVLIVEDSENDAQLLVRILTKAGYPLTFEQVETAAQMRSALEKKPWDIVISDFSMPEMDGHGALKILQETGLDIPFIVVSGVVGEETAVTMMKAGAQDYVMKDNLARLVPAVERELKQVENRRESKQVEQQKQERVKELRLSYGLTYIIEREGITLDEVCRELANILPEGWQFPEITCARIVVNESEFCTENFKESAWMQSSPINVDKSAIGKIEVGYLEKRLEEDEGPFLKEERELIDAIASRLGRFIERKQTEEQIREYIKQLEALLQIESAISSTLDLEEVLNLITAELGKIIRCDSISLQILLNESLEIIACSGFAHPDGVVGRVFPLDPNFPNQKVVTTKEALAIEDVTQEYPHTKNQSNKFSSGNIRSWLGVPLISKGSVKGAITFDRSEVIPFSEDEIQLATTIAGQAILAIENARLFESSERRLKQLSSLRSIDQAISGSLDIKVTLNIILEQVLVQLEVDAAAVLSYLEDLQTLRFTNGRGFQSSALQHTDLRLGEGFAGQVALKREHVFIPDMNQDEGKIQESAQFMNEGFVSYYGVPLITKGKLVGVLEIFHRSTLDPEDEWVNYLQSLASQVAIAIDNITMFNDLQRSNVDLTLAYDATIEGWAHALELRDMESEGHSRRVVNMTVDIARRMGISGEKLVPIRRGALLHDIGKMGVPDAILQKPGKLTEEEWQIMHQHPVYTLDWLYPIEYLRTALEIPYSHHERWDGTGYPRGIKGELIPLAARIFAIVDVWDALISDRPYRKAWSKEKALAHIKEQSGKHFDPQVADVFSKMIEEKDG